MFIILRTIFVVISLFFSSLPFAIAQPKPPQQPISGPGGAEYQHAKVTRFFYGKGVNKYFIFEPADPIPNSAPVIVFNHGWGATNPRSYGLWIEHIVRRGNIVIYPIYQNPNKWAYPPKKVTSNAIFAVKDAINRLQVRGQIKPKLDKFAIVGHSAGGLITANMAALANSVSLPKPRAIMCIEPGISWSEIKIINIPLEDLSKIPEDTLLLTVVGDEDEITGDKDAKKIFNETPQIPLENKDYIIVVSDYYGKPPLIADHFAPVAAGKIFVNALDYYGFWKLFDGLYETAFYGKNRRYALGNTTDQCFMGKWSDGVPVKELIVTDNP